MDPPPISPHRWLCRLAVAVLASGLTAAEPIVLTTQELQASVAPLGAQLLSVIERGTGHEYLWQNEAGIWAGPAPVLFPIVGSVRNRTIRWGNATYNLPQHGFARTRMFDVVRRDATAVTLACTGGGDDSFPAPYRLEIEYRLSGRELQVSARITNPGASTLPVSIGFHPGFNVAIPADPARAATSRVTVTSAAPIVQLVKEEAGGFLTGERRLWSDESRALDLTVAAPGPDALVLALAAPATVVVTDELARRKVTVATSSPFLGLWRKPAAAARFICVEPWWGTTDPSAPYDDFRAKPHLLQVAAGQTFLASFRVKLD
jgi:galactose mutarotase-like enzyme